MKLIASALLGVLFLPFFTYALPNTCFCVLFLREEMGVNIRGDAVQQISNISKWNVDVGDVLLLQYGKVSHAALILGFEWEEGRQTPKSFKIIEANKVRCKVTIRDIAWSDEHIRGIYNPQMSISAL